MRIFVLPAILSILFSLTGTGCGPAGAEDLRQQLSRESTLEQILKRGVLRVGMDTFLPWAMKDKTGKYIGFEIDVATRLAEDMGVKVEFVPTKWAGIIPSLLTGKFDVIIGGMGIQPRRALKVNFTVPYDYSGMAIVASKKLAGGFASLEDFNSPEVQIACKLGTTAVTAAKKFMPNAGLRLFDDEAQVYQELRNNNVHAVVGSAPRPALLFPAVIHRQISGLFRSCARHNSGIIFSEWNNSKKWDKARQEVA